MTQICTGIVEQIEFTQNGMGNQWTTIGGVRYATYWDARNTDWKMGDTVSFEELMSPLYPGNPPIKHAMRIKKFDPLLNQQSETDAAPKIVKVTKSSAPGF